MKFVHDHPWMSFFLGLVAINGVVTIIRGRDTVFTSALLKPTAPGVPGAQHVAGAFAVGAEQLRFPQGSPLDRVTRIPSGAGWMR